MAETLRDRAAEHPSHVVFAKWPSAGRVKTRMVPPLTPIQARTVHTLMLESVVRQLVALPAGARFLAVTPDDACEQAASRWPELDGIIPQGDGDLGQRIVRVMHTIFGRRLAALIILGTDCPDLPQALYRRAADVVGRGECVICPSRDGGYCLIGVPHPVSALFAGIEWGTARVAAQTRAAARSIGVTLTELESWEDVDTFADLKRLAARLVGASEPHLRELRRCLLCAKLPGVDREGQARWTPTKNSVRRRRR